LDKKTHMKIKDIIISIEEEAPLQYQESYDNSGLILGVFEQEISKALICFDLTENVLQEAIEKNCQLIISHHPLIFNPLKKINSNNYIDRILIKAIKHDIAIYAAHTNLDNSYNGLNNLFAQKLSLKNSRILAPIKGSLRKITTFCPEDHAGQVRTAICEAGAGKIGNYDFCTYNISGNGSFRALDKAKPFVGNKNELHFEKEVRIEAIYPVHLEKDIISSLIKSHPYEEVAYDIYPLENTYSMIGSGIIGSLETPVNAFDFLKKLKALLNIHIIKHSALNNKTIQTVALCGGAGSFLFKEAIKQKADIFISSEFKYNQFIDCEDKIIIADIGHYESEHFAKELIYDIIKKKFPNFALNFSEQDANPINYM